MKKLTQLCTGLCLLLSSSSLYAQLNLPADEGLSNRAQSEYAQLSDQMRFDNYKAAKKHLAWLLKNTPELHESIYINGIKVYQQFADDEENPNAQLHQDSVLVLYDLRMKYYDNEKSLIDRKASTAYKYYRTRPEKTEDLFRIFERTYELNGKDVGVNNLATYMDVTRKYNEVKPLGTDEILSRYYRVLDAIDQKEQQGGNGETYEKIRGIATKILLEIVPIDCDFIQKELAPRMQKDPSMAKRIVSLSLSQSCTGRTFFTDAVKLLIKENPDYALLRFLAIKEAEKGNMTEAIKYFNEAINATNDKSKKAQVYYDIAARMSQNNKPEARNYAEKALQTDPEFKKAYKLIGDLYFNSFNDCKEEKSMVSDRAIYWLAYDMYQKSGDQEAMNNAAGQFPTMSDIFTENKEEGKTISIGCWINKSTTIRRRKE
ncbi:hypothetical protein C900_05881 [Fulvivirga imtechensis AK7]|uniref:Tetratricopeptide repeat protein n=1 Tax=Fulvivirga imtechensis AK7 TaxID=1237149 RepID=L8JKD4_9BACT|nr:hypothetical protein [Fulvivirga imtechensis]ELR68698.1 hypothetical protein C900_05881 [Fulvivirga imtechensis AK7]